MKEPSQLGRNILWLRLQWRLKQKTLAERSGVSQALIARIEIGDRLDMRCSHANRIAQALNVTLDDLLNKDLSTLDPHP